MSRFTPLVMVLISAGCGNSGGGGSGGSAGGTQPLTKEFRCFDLPGGSRTNLHLSPDKKHVTYSEYRQEGEAPIPDLVEVDLTTGKATVLATDAQQGQRLGTGLVFLRPTDKSDASWTSWKPRLFIGDKPVSPEGVEVQRVQVDPAGTIFYSTYRYDTENKKSELALWRVAAGGQPVKVRDDFALHGIADGGKTLIGALTNIENPTLVKVPAAGGEPVEVAPAAYVSAIVGDKLVFVPRTDKATMQVVSLAGGTPVPLPGARESSRVLENGDPVLVIDRVKRDPNHIISRTDGVAPLAPIAHLVGVDVSNAVMLPDGMTLAALVVHDTNSDDELDYKDEADLCLIPTSKTPAAFTPPTRKVPKRLASMWTQIEGFASGDLAGAKPRYTFDGGISAVVFATDGAGPATLDELAARAGKLHETIAAGTKDPTLGVLIHWKKNARVAAMLWDGKQGKARPRSGAYGMMVPARSSYPIGAYPKFGHSQDFQQKLPISTKCGGTVTNPGTAPIEVEVECRAWSYESKPGDPTPTISKKTKIKVPPGPAVKYEIDLGRSRMQYNKSEQLFFVDGKETEWFNEYAWEEATDYIATADRVLAATGYLPKELNAVGRELGLEVEHYGNSGAVIPDFNTLPPEKQKEIVKVLWDEWAGHSKRLHGRKPYDVDIHEGSPLGRDIMDGKLQPAR